MKRFLVFILSFSILAAVSGCNSILDSSAERTAYKFIENYFTFHDAEKIIDYETYGKRKDEFYLKFKPFMTSKAYHSFISNMDEYKIFDIAAKGRTSVGIKNIKLKLNEKYKEDNSLYYVFTGDIYIIPIGSTRSEKQASDIPDDTYTASVDNSKLKSQTVNIAGEIMLTKQNDTFKVTHFIMRGTADWFDLVKNYESILN